MATSAAFLSEDQFTCSICLEIFTNPVSTPCGHSFCQACISSYWDKKPGGGGGSKLYQCPLCKETFRKRPELQINRTLKEITEQFKQMSLSGFGMERRSGRGGEGSNMHPFHQQPSTTTLPRLGEMPVSVFAEMMTRFRQLPAAESLQSSNPFDSYSQNADQINTHAEANAHPNPPLPYSPPRRYSFSSAVDCSSNLSTCPIHMRSLEYYCRSDQNCICSTCMDTKEHLGHNIIPAKREWHIKKSQLGIMHIELKDLICAREKKVEEIQNSLREVQAAAEHEKDGALSAFSKLLSSVQRCQVEVLEVIEMSRQAAEHRAQSLLGELEEELSMLKKRSASLSQLTLSEDYLLFFKTFPALSSMPQTKDWSSASVTSELTSGVVVKTVNQLTERLQDELQKLPEMCQRSSVEQSVPRANPKTRKVQEYAADITLDPYTAHPRLIISSDGKQVYCGERHQLVPDNPERFDRVVCVLAHQGFNSGRHYWEVEVGGKTDWDLGVARKSVYRKGKITVSPAHGYWFLSLRDQTDYAFRTEPSTNLTLNLRPSRIGIYVDCDMGLVSFFNVEAKVLIYTFTDCFSEAIHPFFSPCTNKSGRNEAPLIICPVTMVE
ncbi:E3 ubiquitin-protein ligase TRIM21 [Thalassophryne amazonica]|uniref:E3 ubiquitin-protein ligase TRIM21 n=1 Tax=Thalassophryne amazonica TaxID=390379 RepID=UPI00147150F7|nr:E3 ubiquitin-protein ligase TRIM21 [Thalassophryne amazonica]XP_034044512.1 E3 ubiquitin-protein ligase TRIM21 [Thalassophryne amazonica]